MKARLVFGAMMVLASPSGLADQSAGSPRMNYLLHCSGCHRQDGSGTPVSGVPGFRGRLGHFLKVEGGREYLIQVPGTSQSPLSDAETAALLNWLLKTFSASELPADAAPITTGEVARIRREPLVDVPGRRAYLTDVLLNTFGVDLRGYR